jgi:glycosyltransferase involved in cell wall biosynthesis
MEALASMDYPRDCYEVIVVDNGSSDDTVERCRTATKNVYVCPGLTVAALRNFGAEKARGSILAFLDADCVPNRDWLSNAVALLASTLCISGSPVEAPKDERWIGKVWASQSPSGCRETAYINSGNMIVPAPLFRKVSGFNTTLTTGEDYEFCVRASQVTKIVSDDRIRVTHLGNPTTLAQFMRREIWHGLGAFSTLHRRKFDKPLIGTLVFSVLTSMQGIGLVGLVLGHENMTAILAGSSIGLILLLTVTVFYRIRRKLCSMSGLQLMILYYLYYLGRAISLLYIVGGRRYIRKKKK